MRKLILTASAVISVSALALFCKKDDKLEPKKKFAHVMSAPINARLNVNTLIEPSKKQIEKKAVPELCESYFDKLFSLGVKQYMEQLEFESQHEFSCFDYAIPNSNMASILNEKCRLGKDGRLLTPDLCGPMLLFYRAVLVDRATEKDIDFDKMDLQILLSKILGKMMKGEETWKVEKENLLRIGQTIINLEPNNPASYRVMGFIELTYHNFEASKKWAQMGLDLDPEQKDLKNLFYFAEAREKNFDPENFYKNYGHDDQANYWLASHYWREGHSDKVREILSRLINRDPKNERFKKSLDQARASNNPKDKIFEIQIPIIEETW